DCTTGPHPSSNVSHWTTLVEVETSTSSRLRRRTRAPPHIGGRQRAAQPAAAPGVKRTACAGLRNHPAGQVSHRKLRHRNPKRIRRGGDQHRLTKEQCELVVGE